MESSVKELPFCRTPAKHYQAVQFNDSLTELWNGILAHSPNGTFLHHRYFIGYHGSRFVDASTIIFYAGKAVALFPAEREGNRIYSHRGLTYAGWILASGVAPDQIPEIMRETIAYYLHLGIQRMEVRTIPNCFTAFDQESLHHLFAKLGGKTVATHVHHAIPLPHKVSDRGKKWGRKKALMHGLFVYESSDLQAFWKDILQPNLEVHHRAKPTHTWYEMQTLVDRFPDQIRFHGVYQGSELLGGAVVFDTLRCAHLQYIAASKKGRALRCLDLLMGELIEINYAHKAWFNMGVSHIPPSGVKNKGLVTWKESLGGRPVSAFLLQIDLGCYSLSD
ncbi:hypothetical protein ADIS_3761 [Lunatimonas lonarensis]|uniref:Uncharacterized protein n=1 Tax=Lunatimonas lonarensis TaxID=1232681 RepID=R7ZP37_9BACT|nr:GNAT family N-acetyltransferase [Lunatimonas lonarensis]EON75870.1 hypothetical protein ADIS_3761 [Lunatimonas lonarensis]